MPKALRCDTISTRLGCRQVAKAADFESAIRRFESYHPSQFLGTGNCALFLWNKSFSFEQVMSLAILILAAGHGSRMKSKYQKILHPVAGKPMFMHIFEMAEQIADLKPVIVIAPGEDGVPNLVGDRAEYIIQAERLGTGHAALMATDALRGRSSQALVTYGDMPLVKLETMRLLAKHQAETGAALSMLAVPGQPTSTFGRVVRDKSGGVTEIVEVTTAKQREDGDQILAIRELNAGIYCFDASFLWDNLPKLPLRQARSGQEYYLTDMVEAAVRQNLRVEAIVSDDPDEGVGAGTRAELVEVERIFQKRVNSYWLKNGVTIVDPATVWIEPSVQIGRDTIIQPNSFLRGSTKIGEDCIIGPHVVLENVTIPSSEIVPPFTHLKNDP